MTAVEQSCTPQIVVGNEDNPCRPCPGVPSRSRAPRPHPAPAAAPTRKAASPHHIAAAPPAHNAPLPDQPGLPPSCRSRNRLPRYDIRFRLRLFGSVGGPEMRWHSFRSMNRQTSFVAGTDHARTAATGLSDAQNFRKARGEASVTCAPPSHPLGI